MVWRLYSGKDFHPADSMQLQAHWDPVSPKQPALWGGWIELGEAFHETIIAAPIPVDLRALQALKNSLLALDLYAWATYQF